MRKRNQPKKVVCSTCGKEFEKTHIYTKNHYCTSECGQKGKRKNIENYSKRKYLF